MRRFRATKLLVLAAPTALLRSPLLPCEAIVLVRRATKLLVLAAPTALLGSPLLPCEAIVLGRVLPAAPRVAVLPAPAPSVSLVEYADDGPSAAVAVNAAALAVELLFGVPAKAAVTLLGQGSIAFSLAVRTGAEHWSVGRVATRHLTHCPGIEFCNLSWTDATAPELRLAFFVHLSVVPFVFAIVALGEVRVGANPLRHREMDTAKARTLPKSLDRLFDGRHILLRLEQASTLSLCDQVRLFQLSFNPDSALVLGIVLCQGRVSLLLPLAILVGVHLHRRTLGFVLLVRRLPTDLGVSDLLVLLDEACNGLETFGILLLELNDNPSTS